MALGAMTHQLITQIIEIATPLAQKLGLEIVDVVFQTNKRPQLLRVYIRNLSQDTSLDDCEQMSIALNTVLDTADLIPGAYVLEISSPGIPQELTTEREFNSFKGFDVIVTTINPQQTQTQWQGKLIKTDNHNLYLNQKGRERAIPRETVKKVQLTAQSQN